MNETNIEENFFDSTVDECENISIDNCKVQDNTLPNNNHTNDVNLANCCYSDNNICTAETFNSIIITQNYTSCSDFIYDDSVYAETIVTEFDLVCGRSYLADLSTSMYYVGVAIGSVTGGWLASNYGRKVTIILGTFGAIGVSFWTSYQGVF